MRGFCNYSRPDGQPSRWGSEREVFVMASQAVPNWTVAYFNGRRIVACC